MCERMDPPTQAGRGMTQANDALPTLTHIVRAADMVPMADLLHDPNLIHLDPAAVKAAGLGDRVINQGPANLAYIMNMLAKAFPDYRLEEMDSRFLANVRDGDTVEAGGTLTVREGDRITCEIWLNVADVGPAVKGQATLVRRP